MERKSDLMVDKFGKVEISVRSSLTPVSLRRSEERLRDVRLENL
jgi:hypothetical protein